MDKNRTQLTFSFYFPKLSSRNSIKEDQGPVVQNFISLTLLLNSQFGINIYFYFLLKKCEKPLQ